MSLSTISALFRNFSTSLFSKALSKARAFDLLGSTWILLCSFSAIYAGWLYVNPIVFVDYPNWKLFNECLLIYGLVIGLSNLMAHRFIDLRPTPDEIHVATIDYDLSNNNDGCGDAAEPKTKLGSRVRFCEHCQKVQPKRAHHCKLCSICVANHDHHCFFASACVGRNSQKHFIVWTFWLTIACLYGSIVLMYYVCFVQPTDNRLLNILDMFGPPCNTILFVRFLFGSATGLELYFAILIQQARCGLMLGAALCAQQMFLALVGETWFECSNSDKTWTDYYYQMNIHNLQRVFGIRYWALSFFVPFDFLIVNLWTRTKRFMSSNGSEKKKD